MNVAQDPKDHSGNLHIVRNFILSIRLRMSNSPAYATPKLLDKKTLTLNDIDVFEYHEAVADPGIGARGARLYLTRRRLLVVRVSSTPTYRLG